MSVKTYTSLLLKIPYGVFDSWGSYPHLFLSNVHNFTAAKAKDKKAQSVKRSGELCSTAVYTGCNKINDTYFYHMFYGLKKQHLLSQCELTSDLLQHYTIEKLPLKVTYY